MKNNFNSSYKIIKIMQKSEKNLNKEVLKKCKKICMPTGIELETVWMQSASLTTTLPSLDTIIHLII